MQVIGQQHQMLDFGGFWKGRVRLSSSHQMVGMSTAADLLSGIFIITIGL